MTDQVPEAARQLAARLADAFETDRGLAEQLNDCQDRLRDGNGQLWTGLHPDALGLLYDDTAAVGVYEGSSVITGRMIDALHAGLPAAEVEAAVLPGLQEAHWAIHRAFSDYQQISEDRRHLAAEIGELIAGLVAELITAGWSEEQARNAHVQQLAAAAAR
ncbi:MAG: hypothetical protein ABI427_18860 [Solirubrobacteraceae bacterium]